MQFHGRTNDTPLLAVGFVHSRSAKGVLHPHTVGGAGQVNCVTGKPRQRYLSAVGYVT
ncbi:MAG: hypothetical protein FWB78_07965 [Treponema sp.]|nr:hypothetical protein [Treponema sp.]